MICAACSKHASNPAPVPSPFYYRTLSISGKMAGNNFSYTNVSDTPAIQLVFSAPVGTSSADSGIYINDANGGLIQCSYSFPNDTTVDVQPTTLKPLSNYTLHVTNALRSRQGVALQANLSVSLTTGVDSTNKFPVISDSALLTLVEQQTFNYFWTLANPTSGMALERKSQSQVTTGGSGFGIDGVDGPFGIRKPM